MARVTLTSEVWSCILASATGGRKLKLKMSGGFLRHGICKNCPSRQNALQDTYRHDHILAVGNVKKEGKYSPRSVTKPGVTCSGMGRMSCECFRLRHTSWYFVYETTAEPCFDHRRQPGAISSSLCSTTENCTTTALFLSTAFITWH